MIVYCPRKGFVSFACLYSRPGFSSLHSLTWLQPRHTNYVKQSWQHWTQNWSQYGWWHHALVSPFLYSQFFALLFIFLTVYDNHCESALNSLFSFSARRVLKVQSASFAILVLYRLKSQPRKTLDCLFHKSTTQFI